MFLSSPEHQEIQFYNINQSQPSDNKWVTYYSVIGKSLMNALQWYENFFFWNVITWLALLISVQLMVTWREAWEVQHNP